MKKSRLVFTVVLLLASFGPGPLAAAVDIDLGVKAGLSLAQYKWSDADEATATLSKPVFGGFVAFNLDKVFAIQTEAYLLTLGGRNRGEPLTYKLELLYLHFPILAKARLVQKGPLVPVVFAGPTVDFRLSARAKYYDGELILNENIKDAIQGTNLGFAFGAGVEYTLERFSLLLDIRYDLGLADVEKYAAATMKTRALMFMVGVGF